MIFEDALSDVLCIKSFYVNMSVTWIMCCDSENEGWVIRAMGMDPEV